MAEALRTIDVSAKAQKPAVPAAVNDNTRTLVATTLVVENMHCGGCMRTIEGALAKVDGVRSARANLSARRVTALVESGKVGPLELVDVLAKAGFKSAELVETTADPRAAEARDLWKRLGVAGFAAANIMLLSVSVWSGHGEMDPSLKALFHWISALIALPAVAYAGRPFFRSAAGALAHGRVNMDVPISLGVLLATGMSVFQTTRGSDQVYFDAAVTLLFFLLIGRALDLNMRTRAAGAAANLIGLNAVSASVIDTLGVSLVGSGSRPRGSSPGPRVSSSPPGPSPLPLPPPNRFSNSPLAGDLPLLSRASSSCCWLRPRMSPSSWV